LRSVAAKKISLSVARLIGPWNGSEQQCTVLIVLSAMRKV